MTRARRAPHPRAVRPSARRFERSRALASGLVRAPLAIGLAAGLGLLAACAAPEPDMSRFAEGVELAQTTRLRAEVISVDRSRGEIVMKDVDTGKTFTHRPPSEMSEVIDVKPGDIVVVARTRAVTAWPATEEDMAGPDETQTDVVTVPAAAGASPAFVGGKLVRAVVTLEAWNPETNVAVARTPEGVMTRYHVPTLESQEFMASLEPGDKIATEFSDTVVVKLVE